MKLQHRTALVSGSSEAVTVTLADKQVLALS
jgi:hypothetical protein